MPFNGTVFIACVLNVLIPVLCCTLPPEIVGQWTDDHKSGSTITFTSSQMTGWPVTIQGQRKSSHTCISNIGNVYIFRGDEKYTEFPKQKSYYLCMKLTEVSSNTMYYYLLADENRKAGGERVFTPNFQPDPSTPTCGYCSFFNTIPDTDVRIIKKLGTSEELFETPSLCLPCEATSCETSTTSSTMTSTPKFNSTLLSRMETSIRNTNQGVLAPPKRCNHRRRR